MNKKALISLVIGTAVALSSLYITPVLAEPDKAGTAAQTAAEGSGTDNASVSGTVSETAAAEDSFPEIHGEGALLMDMKSGKILYEKNVNEKLYPASTTKIMTGIIALEEGDLSEVVAASSEAIAPITNKHSHMGILVGEELTMEQLIYGMLVYSANDAANVIAVRLAGSLDAFAEKMNEKAAELGCTGTHFANPHGFHDDNHYTTPSDLAKIARYAMNNEKFREIVSTDMYTIQPTNKYKEIRYLSNTNHLVSRRRSAYHYYKKAIGIKTGYTDEAGSCLVAAAADGDTEFLSVIMKCKNENSTDCAYSFTDTAAMLKYAFDNYSYKTLASVGDIVADSKVYEAKNDVRVALTPEVDVKTLLANTVDMSLIKAEPVLNEKIAAPIEKGQALGTVSYTLDGELLGSAQLVATNSVERDAILHVIHLAVKIITNPFFIAAAVILLFLIVKSNLNRKRRRKQRRSRLTYISDAPARSTAHGMRRRRRGRY